MNRDDENAATQAYIENYRATYNMEPDMVGASVYDAFQVIFAAIENVGTDTEAMRAYIAGLENFDTVTGTLMFYTENGSAVKLVQIQQVVDGAFHHFSTVDDPAIINPTSYSK